MFHKHNHGAPVAVADLGFPVGGRGARKGEHGFPRQLHFENVVYQNKRILTLGGVRWARPPLDPPMSGAQVSLLLESADQMGKVPTRSMHST